MALTDRMRHSLAGTSLQRRHFELIAKILSDMDMVTTSTHRKICEHFANRLADSNTSFQRERFMRACDVE